MAKQRTRRRPRAETRQELLDAAARVFARRGFHGASVEAIADEAGFSTGAVYSNFASKEELFLKLYEERIERRRRELGEAVVGAGGGLAGLASAASDAEKALETERDWFLLYYEFVLHAARNPTFARRFAAVRDEGIAQLAQGIAAGLDHADARASLPAQEIAEAIRALTYGLAADRLIQPKRGPDQRLARILEVLFRGLHADAAASERND